MSDSAQNGRTSKQKSQKIQVLFTEETNYEIDRLVGEEETQEADISNQKAVKHQQIHDNKVENEQYEESDSF